jgi:aminopeptidase N
MMDVQLSKKFEFPGSKKQYADSIKFNIDYMILDIKPDFKFRVLKNCEQQIDITATININVLKFVIAELDIHNICLYYLDKDIEENPIDVKPKFEGKNLEKLIIELPDTLYSGKRLRLKISYSCGFNGNKSYIKPRSGFHFIEDENYNAYQAWTQGETIESRYWFPCIDHPQIKYKREVRVTVPDNFTVISNGDPFYSNDNKKTWIWKGETPNPSYLTSVAIGEFDEGSETYTNIENEKVELKYYWPKRIPTEDAMRSYSKTSEILNFFEYLLNTKYPYKKYSQVAVDEFEFGGMENTNATTLNENLFHDKTASLDFGEDVRVIVHELAHQWFGDFVTCEDWQDIWLNEGFANYCEALYLDKEYIYNPNSTTNDQSIRNEFFYKVFSVAQSYLGDAANFYQRAIVTNIYKHPDELLDGHAYAKAGSVLHMLRSMIKDDILFRKALSNYLKEHKFGNSETDDLRQMFEKITGLNLLQFFDQWLYRSGHPEIEVELSLNQSNELQIKIKQVQECDPFIFPLEAKIVYKSGKEEIKRIEIVNKDQDYKYNLPAGEQIDWISIDPEFKILKNIKKIIIPNETSNFRLIEFLKQQLLNGETVIEKIEAARELKKHYSEDILEVLKEVIKLPVFYGVGVEVANTIGAFKDDSDWTKTKKAYDTLKECLENGFSTLPPQVRQSIVSNIGRFQIEESIPKFKLILDNVNESYFVRSSAATSLALSSVKLNSKEKKLETITILKDLINESNSFRQVIAAGAINGLMQFYNDSDPNIIINIGTFLINKTSTKKTINYYIQIAAINAIRKFVRTKNHLDNTDIIDLNRCVFNRLIELLDVKLLDNLRWQVKIRAATSLVDSDALSPIPDAKTFKTMDILISAIQHDVNGFVQKSIERSLYVLRDNLQKWLSNPPAIEFKRKVDARKKEEKMSMELIELTQPERIVQEKILESIRTLELP